LTGFLWQVLWGYTGLFLGCIEFFILGSTPFASGISTHQIWLPALILLVFTGFLEEIIFRGVLQITALQYLGKTGILYISVVFTLLHLGYYSILNLAFVFFVALLFGWFAKRSKSILGVCLAHGLINIMVYLIIPLLWP
jgi:uncharacterized protein